MPTIPGRATQWLCIALAGLLWLPLASATALAQEATGPTVGGSATIADPGGEGVLLRAEPSYDAAVLTPLAVGTPVEVIDGPASGPNGTEWYGVAAVGQTGYVPVGALTGAVAAPAPELAAPQPAPAAPEPAPAPVPEPAAPVAPDVAAETAETTDAVNLRADPSAEAPVLLVVPAGSRVTRAGDASNGFARVSYEGTTGWAALPYLRLDAAQPATDAPPAPEAVPAPAAEAASGAAVATELLNLRAGPSYDDEVLRVMPPGAPLTITGAASGGFVPVLYNGTPGWVDAAYIDTSGAAPPADPAAESAPAAADGAATTTDAVNLRSEPSEAAPVQIVVPTGTTVETTGAPQDGFYPVRFADQTGWVSGEYLSFEGSAPVPAGPGPAPDDPLGEPAVDAAAASGGSGLIWPVSGGTWSIMQGYNGSSHQNQGSTWQYYYSLDLVSADGNTAGQPVRSPATGTVRWTDPSSGGIAIDIGNGHAVALYHVAVDPSIEWGDPIAQGEYLGTVSGPGGPGFAGTPHVHFALWETTDGGNWSRVAVPFVGPYAISGQEFPDIGGGNQHRGVEFTP